MPTRLPEGCTYLGTVGFGFQGPNLLEGAVPCLAGHVMPSNGFHNDYGAKVTWAPQWLGGTFGFYYRNLTETQPWVLMGMNPTTGATNYHLAYGSDVKLYGMSLDRQIGDFSTGFEVSYRHNTALTVAPAPWQAT